jgi:acetyl esterase/lipase
MGGFGSLDLGRIAPKRFCAVARHDLLRLARDHSPYDAPVWIDIGDHDYLRPGAEALARELKTDGADVTFHVWPGIHNGRYWDAHFRAVAAFLRQVVRLARSTDPEPLWSSVRS